MLEHAPHGIHVIAGKPPVSPRFDVAKSQLLGDAELAARGPVRDLARHELEAAARTLVVEEDAGNRVQAEALAIVQRDPMAVDFRHPVGTARIERRGLALRWLDHLAEHLTETVLLEDRFRR